MINPVGLTVQQWADAVVLALPGVTGLGRLADPERWQDFAVGLVRAPELVQRVLPDPYQFSDWREWAMRAYPMMEGLG